MIEWFKKLSFTSKLLAGGCVVCGVLCIAICVAVFATGGLTNPF